jgi:hypothetical protein
MWPSSGDSDHLMSWQCHRSQRSSSCATEVGGGAIEGGGGIDVGGARKVKCGTKSSRTHGERGKNKIVDVTSKNTDLCVTISWLLIGLT